jgi:hypothetical protein
MTTDERSTLRNASIWLLAASAGWWVAAAALIPGDDFFAGDSARTEAISIAENAGMFRAFHAVAVLATASGAVGVVLATRALQAQRRSPLARAASALAVVGIGAWIVEALLRATVAVSRARDVVAGTRAPGDEPAIGNRAVFAVAALGFIAPMIGTWAMARARMPEGRSTLAVAGFTTLVTFGSIAILAPSPVYQFAVLALAVFLLVRTRHSQALSSAATAPG